MTNNKTKQIVGIAVLASLAWIISLVSFPLVPAFPFLKIDFSDLPILFGMYVYGPVGGMLIAFLRSLLSYAQSGGEMGVPIGDTAAFIASMSLTLPIYLFIRNGKAQRKEKILSGIFGTVLLTCMLALINWLFIAPAYMTVMGLDVGPMRDYVLLGVVPFNLLKGPIITGAFFIGFAKLKTWLDKMRRKMGRPTEKIISYEN